jgi:DNA primase
MFSCGAGGTVLDFVAAMESCSLLEAERRIITAGISEHVNSRFRSDVNIDSDAK